MKVKIISKPNQNLKYPDFDTEGIDEDDYEYIYCEDFSQQDMLMMRVQAICLITIMKKVL